jgi:hypothetical protein
MWYKLAKKYNSFGLPISDYKYNVKQFQAGNPEIEDESLTEEPDTNVDENGVEIPEITPKPGEITIDDPTPEDGFSPADLQAKIQELEVDPTAHIKLPPLHENPDPHCYCKIESRPILSQPGVNDARRVWIVNHFNKETGRPINNCPKCTASAQQFNELEAQRLRNKGIDVNPIA